MISSRPSIAGSLARTAPSSATYSSGPPGNGKHDKDMRKLTRHKLSQFSNYNCKSGCLHSTLESALLVIWHLTARFHMFNSILYLPLSFHQCHQHMCNTPVPCLYNTFQLLHRWSIVLQLHQAIKVQMKSYFTPCPHQQDACNDCGLGCVLSLIVSHFPHVVYFHEKSTVPSCSGELCSRTTGARVRNFSYTVSAVAATSSLSMATLSKEAMNKKQYPSSECWQIVCLFVCGFNMN